MMVWSLGSGRMAALAMLHAGGSISQNEKGIPKSRGIARDKGRKNKCNFNQFETENVLDVYVAISMVDFSSG